MGKITPQRWREIREVFDQAQALPREQRDAFLVQACAGDGDLRREVESLLGSLAGAGTFIDQPALSLGEDESAALTLDSVGPYRLLEPLGRGGMGEVFLAVRDDDAYRKKVAVKVLKRGMDTEELVRRFRGERQILANLEHPNICRLLDGGSTADGRPYLVMDYVAGEPIDRHCDTHRLSTPDRVRLFRKVCSAVHFAHQNLVVHRDLKPGNILIGPDGEPKLLDFGIAKLLSPADFPQTLVATDPGAMPMTPRYASPEQVRGEAVTTGSDVYSLGVVLYELLTGHPAYRATGEGSQDFSSAVQEEIPARPSTVVLRPRTLQLPDGEVREITPQAVSAVRDGDPQRLRKRLAGDLDNVVLMALRKEPQRRYASAQQLSDDLANALAGRPVAARSDTLAYRTSKFVGRHKASVVLASLALLLLMSFTTALLLQRRAIVDEWGRAEAVSGFLVDLFATADPSLSRGDSVTARELLDRGAAEIGSRFRDRPAVLGRLAGTMGQSYRNLGLLAEAERQLSRALEMARREHGGNHPEVIDALEKLADVESLAGAYESAEALAQEALDLQRSRRGGAAEREGRVLLRLAKVTELRGEFPRAAGLVDQALAILRRSDHPATLASALDQGAAVASKQGDFAVAETLSREALAIRQDLHGELHPAVALTLNDLAMILKERDLEAGAELLRESISLQRRLYDGPHPYLGTTLNNLGLVLHASGDLPAAQAAYEEAVEVQRQVYAGAHAYLGASLGNLGDVLFDLGQPAAAEARHREAVAMLEDQVGRDHPQTAMAIANLARDRAAAGAPEEAEALFRESLAALRARLGDQHHEVGSVLNNLGELAQGRGDLEEARRLYQEAIAIERQALGESHPNVAVALYNLGSLELQNGESEAARESYGAAVAAARESLGAVHPTTAVFLAALADLELQDDRLEEAEELARQALRAFEGAPPDTPWRISALRSLADSLSRQGRVEAAEPLWLEGAELLAPTPESGFARYFNKRLKELYGRPGAARSEG